MPKSTWRPLVAPHRGTLGYRGDMTRSDRSLYIRACSITCHQTILIRAGDWGKTVGALQNSLRESTMGTFLMGGEVLETKHWDDDTRPVLIVWAGNVEDYWEPLCAVVDFCDQKLCVYYNAI